MIHLHNMNAHNSDNININKITSTFSYNFTQQQVRNTIVMIKTNFTIVIKYTTPVSA